MMTDLQNSKQAFPFMITRNMIHHYFQKGRDNYNCAFCNLTYYPFISE